METDEIRRKFMRTISFDAVIFRADTIHTKIFLPSSFNLIYTPGRCLQNTKTNCSKYGFKKNYKLLFNPATA